MYINKKILMLTLIMLISNVSVTAAYAADNPTETIVAGAEMVMHENMENLAYKEMVKISTLLMTDPVMYMVELNRIRINYAEYLDNTTTIYDVYPEEDIEYLQRCVETETHGCQNFIDKVNVVNVIFNRAKDDSEKFPDTLKGVITAPGQFAYGKVQIDPLTIAACEYAYIAGDTTNGALWFHSGSKTERFSGGEYLFSDDTGHHYYR